VKFWCHCNEYDQNVEHQHDQQGSIKITMQALTTWSGLTSGCSTPDKELALWIYVITSEELLQLAGINGASFSCYILSLPPGEIFKMVCQQWGLNHAPFRRPELESGALDHSATLTFGNSSPRSPEHWNITVNAHQLNSISLLDCYCACWEIHIAVPPPLT
jgi:hypothetical protein